MSGSYEVEFYVDDKGRCPTDEFLDSLPEKHLARVHAYLDLLEQGGPNLARPYADALADKIRELRPAFGRHEYRLLYFFSGRTVVITHGFLKKSDKVPGNEIERALRCMDDWRARRPSDEG